MPDPTPTPEREPTLTIDFVGLCAFVAHCDPDKPDKPDKVTVLLMDAEKAAPKDGLCRHDPVLVFDKSSFRGAGPDTDHFSFTSLNGKDIGIWNLRGTDLWLELADPDTTTTPLELDCSYHQVLGLETLTGKSNKVNRRWVDGWRVPGAAARLTIEHGRLEANTLSDPWFPGTAARGPSRMSVQFHQVVRWLIDADAVLEADGLRLSASATEWILLGPQEAGETAKVLISNLCPLSTGNTLVSEDVLAYYDMAFDKVASNNRLVLYRNQNAGPVTQGSNTRPGSDACPPVKGVSS